MKPIQFLPHINLMACALGICGLAAIAQATSPEILSLCGQCVGPTIFSKSGIGTAHAVAQARITFKEAKNHCEAFASPASAEHCTEEANQAVKEEAGKIYRATANCLAGRITPIDGKTYTLAGKWTGADIIGKGRTKWRDASGRIVSTSEADGGLAISQQWEVLGPARQTASTKPRRS